MANRDDVTAAGAVVAPAPLPEGEEVKLLFLRDRDGAPVRVWVAPLPELELMDLLAALPAAAPHDEATESTGLASVWETFRPYATGIIERCCTPAFSFAEPTPEGRVPGAWLRDSERMALVVTALRVSGWMGGAAETAARFLRGRPERGTGDAAPARADGDGDREPVPAAEAAVGAVPAADGDIPAAG